MEDGRALLKTLETSTRHNLSLHLLSAFLVKTLRRPRKGEEEEGEDEDETDLDHDERQNTPQTRPVRRFFPPRNWTAWPLDPSVVPKIRLVDEANCAPQISNSIGAKKLIMSRSAHRHLLSQGFNPDIVRILSLTPHEANQLHNACAGTNNGGGTLEAHVNLATQVQATVERHINRRLCSMGLERNLDVGDIDLNLYSDYDVDVLKAHESVTYQGRKYSGNHNSGDVPNSGYENCTSDFTCYTTSSIMELVHSVVDSLLLMRTQQSAGLESVKRFHPMGAQEVLMALEQVIAGNTKWGNKLQDLPSSLRNRLSQLNNYKRKYINEVGGIQALGGGQPVFIDGLQDDDAAAATTTATTSLLAEWQAYVDRNGFDTLDPISSSKKRRKRHNKAQENI